VFPGDILAKMLYVFLDFYIHNHIFLEYKLHSLSLKLRREHNTRNATAVLKSAAPI
jgi:hypothetical protein